MISNFKAVVLLMAHGIVIYRHVQSCGEGKQT
jgi:hypothetical protein